MGFFRLLFLFMVIYFLVKTVRRLANAYLNQQAAPRKFTRKEKLSEIEEADYEIIEPKNNGDKS